MIQTGKVGQSVSARRQGRPTANYEGMDKTKGPMSLSPFLVELIVLPHLNP